MNLTDLPHRELPRWLSGKESACWASLVAQLVTNLPAMRETWVHSLGDDLFTDVYFISEALEWLKG